MMQSGTTLDDLCRQLVARFADRPSLMPPEVPGEARTMHDLYLPLLVSYTQEDKAAKGLRSLADPAAPRPVVHFTAIEVVAAHAATLLMGPAGSGKTSFALNLAVHLAGAWLGTHDLGLERLRRPVPRNDMGLVLDESWTGGMTVPVYLPVQGPENFATLVQHHAPGLRTALAAPDRPALLLILDGAERLGDTGATVLAEMLEWAAQTGGVSVLALGRAEICAAWAAPEAFASFQLLPLLQAQKHAFDPHTRHLDQQRTDLFILATASQATPQPDHLLVDDWLVRYVPGQLDALAAWAYAQHLRPTQLPAVLADRLGRIAGSSLMTTTLVPFLIARHLKTLPLAEAIAVFRTDPFHWAEPMGRLGDRLHGQQRTALVRALASADPLGAILAADIAVAHSDGGDWSLIEAALVALINAGDLTAAHRRVAGRHLARRGDPRDLQEMISLPGGTFEMGASDPAPSRPAHSVTVRTFAISRYPVTNAAYAAFTTATGRRWRSTDGRLSEQSNAPATDLTWHDANAYCAWLTDQWRATARIGADQYVRLPTEAEWEYAARGHQPDHSVPLYPWQGEWAPDRANSSETGFNASCAVGLFPRGRSWCALDDLTGQVWEWTTTLWGDDMAQPHWTYPYVANDGREAREAAPQQRRVLRGGCFSSGRQKACCTYRGSLEPEGAWRGNGFRIVVSNP